MPNARHSKLPFYSTTLFDVNIDGNLILYADSTQHLEVSNAVIWMNLCTSNASYRLHMLNASVLQRTYGINDGHGTPLTADVCTVKSWRGWRISGASGPTVLASYRFPASPYSIHRRDAPPCTRLHILTHTRSQLSFRVANYLEH
jgi:hypothetical protein